MERTIAELVHMTIEEMGDSFQPLSKRVRKTRDSIAVEQTGDGLVIHIVLVARQLTELLSLCLQLQRHIKEQVEALTGLAVYAVHLKIEGAVRSPQDS